MNSDLFDAIREKREAAKQDKMLYEWLEPIARCHDHEHEQRQESEMSAVDEAEDLRLMMRGEEWD